MLELDQIGSETVTAIVEHPLWATSADGLALVGSAGVVLATNPVFERLTGHHDGALVGRSIDEVVPEAQRVGHAGLRRRYEDAPQARTMGASRLLEAERADGSTFPVTISLSRIDTGGGDGLTVAAVRDLTARVRAEGEVAQAQRRRALAEDHDRIAGELHDSVIQQLFALGLRLQGLPARVDDPEVALRVGDAVTSIDGIIAEIRSAIHGLLQPEPIEQRLRHRILSVVSEMEDVVGHPPEVSLVGTLDELRDGAVVDNLLPTLREALANVGKHADASSVAVRVEVGEVVRLEVVDDGVGIPAGVERSGLSNLDARARALGGLFRADPVEPSGTRIVWEVPIANSSADPAGEGT